MCSKKRKYTHCFSCAPDCEKQRCLSVKTEVRWEEIWKNTIKAIAEFHQKNTLKKNSISKQFFLASLNEDGEQ